MVYIERLDCAGVGDAGGATALTCGECPDCVGQRARHRMIRAVRKTPHKGARKGIATCGGVLGVDHKTREVLCPSIWLCDTSTSGPAFGHDEVWHDSLVELLVGYCHFVLVAEEAVQRPW